MQLRQSLAPSEAIEEKKAERPIVLVVDDQPAIQDMLSWVLHFQGYQPVAAANGQEALEWIEDALQREQYPLAILLDLFMPVLSGESFLASLHARWDAPVPVPPVILLTVDTNKHDELACFDVLMKPFHIDDLYERLRQVVRLRHMAKRDHRAWQ